MQSTQLTAQYQPELDHRPGDSFAYQSETTRPYGCIDAIIDWCKSELNGDWRWQVLEYSTDTRPGTYKFYFDSERDCCAFSLKWA
jgi:hypothetical protein